MPRLLGLSWVAFVGGFDFDCLGFSVLGCCCLGCWCIGLFCIFLRFPTFVDLDLICRLFWFVCYLVFCGFVGFSLVGLGDLVVWLGSSVIGCLSFARCFCWFVGVIRFIIYYFKTPYDALLLLCDLRIVRFGLCLVGWRCLYCLLVSWVCFSRLGVGLVCGCYDVCFLLSYLWFGVITLGFPCLA